MVQRHQAALGVRADTAPLENSQDPSGDLRFFGVSGGVPVFVDQAAQDGFSVDPFAVEVGNGEVVTVVFTVGDALGDALVRPGRVVVHLVFGQDGAQMALPEDQHAAQELTAQGADEALADRVHPRSLDGGAQDPGAGGLENGVERGSEVRSAIADQEPDAFEPLAEGEGEVAALLQPPVAGGVRGDAAQMHPAGTMPDEHQHVQSPQQHRVHVQEINREDPGRLGVQELPPRRGARDRSRACPSAGTPCPFPGPLGKLVP